MQRTKPRESSHKPTAREEAIHRALLTGLLSNIGERGLQHEYTGTRGTKFSIFPGSALFKANPTWIMAGELVETTKLYARTVATIRPEWIERAAGHLIKKTYSEPHWQAPSAHVVAYEKVMLRGLVIVPRRTVHYGPIDPRTSREIFIQHALVMGDFKTSADSILSNLDLLDSVLLLEAKTRREDLLVDPAHRFAFYHTRLPADVYDGPRFEQWRREIEKTEPNLLRMELKDMLVSEGFAIDQSLYPDFLDAGGVKNALEYQFKLGQEDDGITAVVPLAALNQLAVEPFEWLVPGQLKEKIDWLIRSLPKTLRVLFVPVPEVAEKAYKELASGHIPSPCTQEEGRGGGDERTLNAERGTLKGSDLKHNAGYEKRELPLPSSSSFSVQNSALISNPLPTPPPEYKGREENTWTAPDVSLRRALADYLGRTAGVTVRVQDFDVADMPVHLKMNFCIVDSAGNAVSIGRDLRAIREFLGVKAKAAFATLPSSQWNRDKLSRWDFGDIPPSVEIRHAGLTLNGYPALVDQGTSVSLRLFDSPEAAAVAMRSGLVRLFMVQLHKEVNYLEQSIANIEQLCLYYAPLGPCDQLREQISRAAADRALFGYRPYVRTRLEFIERAEAGWRFLSAAASEIQAVVNPALATFHELSLELQKPSPPMLRESIEDMRRHLQRLIPADFVTTTPFNWLVHLPRFLSGMQMRLKKLRSAGAVRDLQNLMEVREWEEKYQKRKQELKAKGSVDPAMDEFRWLLEEFRVSLFAQELKTSVPISSKRLEAHWEELVR
ncbi:MAG TPA: DUF3418 domain-containing protein [Tepidisphaeraceae bacterium]